MIEETAPPSPITQATGIANDLNVKGDFEWRVETQAPRRGINKLYNIPILIRYILYIIMGWAILAIPGLISFYLFTRRVVDENIFEKNLPLNFTSNGDIVFERFTENGFAIEGFPAFFYCVYLAARYRSYKNNENTVGCSSGSVYTH
jgi:hypothetical protein